jgi:hypothetical protein
MPPQLTETWGATYFHILIILLVFAFGIPALISQLIIPEEIRRIIHRHRLMRGWFISTIVSLLGLFILFFIWFVHPCSGDPVSQIKSLLGGAFVTIALILTVLLWWNVLRRFIREKVINDLEKNLKERFRKNGVLPVDCLIDLIYLGERGEPGYEKGLVLNALDGLAKNVQSSNRYVGYELEHILRNIDRILLNKEKFGSEENFQSAVCKLGDMLHRGQRANLPSDLDANLALRSLGRLGVATVELRYETTAQMILQATDSKDEVLFEIGLSAINSKRFLITTAALNKLEALTLIELPITSERTNNLLGLIAHFWGAGESARRRAEIFLSSNKNNFSPSLADCINQAIEYHYHIAQFETADKLIVLKSQINK